MESSEIEQILHLKEQDEDAIYFTLGTGVAYEIAGDRLSFSYDYVELGKKFGSSLQYELYLLLCIPKENKPKDWVSSFIDGNNARELAAALFAAVLSKYDVSVSIAIPATALVLKKGLLNFAKQVDPTNHLNQLKCN